MVPLLERLKKGPVLPARNRPESPGLHGWEKRALSTGTEPLSPLLPLCGACCQCQLSSGPHPAACEWHVPVLCETPQWALDTQRSTSYAKMKDGYTKLLGLRLEKSIRPKIGLWSLQSNIELISNMGCTCKHIQLKCQEGDGGLLLLPICHVHITGSSREFADLKHVITLIKGGISIIHSFFLVQICVCQNQFLRKHSLHVTNARGPLTEEMTLIFARSIVNRTFDSHSVERGLLVSLTMICGITADPAKISIRGHCSTWMSLAFGILTEGVNFAIEETLDLQMHYQPPPPSELGENCLHLRTGKKSSLASLLSFQSAGTLKSMYANRLHTLILSHQHAVHLAVFI